MMAAGCLHHTLHHRLHFGCTYPAKLHDRLQVSCKYRRVAPERVHPGSCLRPENPARHACEHKRHKAPVSLSWAGTVCRPSRTCPEAAGSSQTAGKSRAEPSAGVPGRVSAPGFRQSAQARRSLCSMRSTSCQSRGWRSSSSARKALSQMVTPREAALSRTF